MVILKSANALKSNRKQVVGAQPPGPAMEACSGSLEPGLAIAMQLAGRTRRLPSGCTRQTSDSIIA